MAKNQFLNSEKVLKLTEKQFHEKKLIYLISWVFSWTFFKFSGPLCQTCGFLPVCFIHSMLQAYEKTAILISHIMLKKSFQFHGIFFFSKLQVKRLARQTYFDCSWRPKTLRMWCLWQGLWNETRLKRTLYNSSRKKWKIKMSPV